MPAAAPIAGERPLARRSVRHRVADRNTQRPPPTEVIAPLVATLEAERKQRD